MMHTASDTWPKVSVVITNYNSVEYLEECIGSILRSDYPDLEVIFVDNASTDGSAELVERLFRKNPRVTLILNKKNLGAAIGKNMGIRRARGKYVALLDGDTKVDELCLKEAVRRMETDPTISMIQCKLTYINDPNRIDYAGDYLSQFGFLIQRAIAGKIVDGPPDRAVEIFAVKDAGAVARLDALVDIDLYDEDYFLYLEETDLCWRIWLKGYRVIYLPTSIVYHGVFRPAKYVSPFRRYVAQYYGTRNYIMTLIKNLNARNLVKILPFHVGLWLGLALLAIQKRDISKASYVLKGILWNLRNIGLVWRKRHAVQKGRKQPDALIMAKIMRKGAMGYFFKKAKRWGVYAPGQPYQ